MSDLTPIGNPDKDLSIEELAKYQPKRVDETKRSNKPMSKLEWYEIVQWLQLRKADAATWEEVYIESWYSDLANYTKNDVFYAVKSLYDEGRSKAPDGSILRTESPFDLLERIKKVATEWVQPGHKRGSNTHNVSATVSLKQDEWDKAGKWMWDNRDYYNGLSVLPYDGGTYTQAPFEDIDKSKYETMMKSLTDVNLTSIVEVEDETDLAGELACAGGACEIG